ncbi:MAG: hypothetical protein JNL70_25240 [Saprospiraceae bacterium]|nr:hypothetical protein [Saprospiraceae bacterium]
MQTSDSSFFAKSINPIIQGLTILSVSFIAMLLLKIVHLIHLAQISGQVFWIIAGTAILLFALFNSVLSLSAKDMNLYWTRAIPTYAALMVTNGTLAYLFSSMAMHEAGTFRWIFMVLTFGYLLFLSMMRFLRKIVQIAQKEDDRWMKRMK